jgi:hypothetical protein
MDEIFWYAWYNGLVGFSAEMNSVFKWIAAAKCNASIPPKPYRQAKASAG